MNKGLLFEWCIYYLVHFGRSTKPADFAIAKSNYKASPVDVKNAAADAVGIVEAQFGKIINVTKLSGGDEPKTDLLFRTSKKAKLKCSLKYGSSIQLSSGGVSSTTKFLLGVVNDLRSEQYDNKKFVAVIKALTEFEEEYGGLGKMPSTKANKLMSEGAGYDKLLKDILGSRQNPNVKAEYEIIKHAVVKEAMTGKKTFGGGDKSAEYVLTETYLKKIDDTFVKEVASKTSVRLALKGRGSSGEVRLNEIVVRFDAN